MAQPIIKSKRSGYHRAVALVLRQRAKRGGLFKKQRYVPDVADVGVVLHRVFVIKMEGVMKVVAVNKAGTKKQEKKKVNVRLFHLTNGLATLVLI